MKPLRLLALLLVWVLAAAAEGRPLAFQDQTPAATVAPAEPETKTAPPATRLSLRLDYLRKEDATQREDYGRISFALDQGPRFWNPRGGIESRMNNSEFITVWFGDDIVIAPGARVSLRYNHVRYSEWDAAINFVNAYYVYEWRWLHLAAGFGYAALNLDPDSYWNPFELVTDTPETRFIYEVSVRPVLWKNRLELDLGFRNFDDFEYHGFDDNGYHLEPIFHLSPHTTVHYLYDRRYAGAFIGLPTLTRTTWMVSVEHRF